MMRKPSQQANSVPTSRIDNPFEVTILSKGLALVFVCGLVVSLSGCQGHEEIRSYQVPREQPLRMLGAIVPHGEVVWFVKLVGPEPAVEEQKQQFRDLVLSFRFDDKAGLPLTWTTPKGWREVRDDRRYGTFQIGPKEDGLEVTVFDLGRKGGGGSVLANVNRWRGQLGLWPTTPGELTGLPVLGPSSLGLLGGPSGQSPFLATSTLLFPGRVGPAKLTELLTVGDDVATLVDLLGTGPHLVTQGPQALFLQDAQVEKREAPADVGYDMPAGWEKAPPKPFSKETFRTGNGESAAEVTVSRVGGGLALNLTRWREQLRLPEVGEEELGKDVKEFDVGDVKSAYAEYEGVYMGNGPLKGKPAKILGVIADFGQSAWVFKMTGPPEVVRGQKAAFEKFLRSVRFEKGKEK